MSCCKGNTCSASKSSRDLTINTSQSPQSLELQDIFSSGKTDTNKSESDEPSSSKIALDVSGMTCTGCLVKLERALMSIPEVSKVKASLLLSQATFDIQETDFLNERTISHIIMKKTGFTCAVI